MRKTLCIIACIVAAFASLFTLAACTTEGAPGAYYSVAVDGGTGSGKSSLLLLLCRLYAPSEGRVTVGGAGVFVLEVSQFLKV